MHRAFYCSCLNGEKQSINKRMILLKLEERRVVLQKTHVVFAFLENTVENIYKIYEKIYNILVDMIGSESSCLKE